MTANHHENNGAERQRVEELAVLATTRGLDQLTAEEEAELASALTKPANKELQGASEQASRVAAAVAAAITSNELPSPSVELRVAIEAELDAALVSPAEASKSEVAVRMRRVNWYRVSAVLLTVAGVFACLLIPALQVAREGAPGPQLTVMSSPQDNAEFDPKIQGRGAMGMGASFPQDSPVVGSRALNDVRQATVQPGMGEPAGPVPSQVFEGDSGVLQYGRGQPTPTTSTPSRDQRAHHNVVPTSPVPNTKPGSSDLQRGERLDSSFRSVAAVPDALPSVTTTAPLKGMSVLTNPTDEAKLTQESLPSPYYLSDHVQYFEPSRTTTWHAEKGLRGLPVEEYSERGRRLSFGKDSGEAYAAIRENTFRMVRDEPLSTFSIDVDTASYANVRRFLTAGQLPPKDAVRIEELLNYFSYDYPQPQEKDPFSVNMEVTDCPWRPENLLLRVGLKGREIARQQRAASNLVFLIDVSGSMQPENKLPLVKTALKMLVQELTENDRVSIVTYAGDAGLKLPSTNGTEQSRILSTIDSLSAGGSTHGSAGIELAYEQASGYFIRGGTNRVILLTDGDLNVGITDDNALIQVIQQKAKSGVFLTVLGVGEGNLKDSKMEKLADHGNGVYAYLDGVREARKVLVEQMSGSLVTIAKDVKLQIEFNPAQVQAYRLVGYENRVLANRDFHDDTKDAGEIGAGHTVTALYELVPTNSPVPSAGEPLKYQPQRVEEAPATASDQASRELLTLKLRFKHPEAERSELRDYPLSDRGGKFGQASTDFRFASSVAMFGLVLRDSQYRGSATLAAVEEIATSSLGQDPRGYRSEFVDLVRKAEQLK